MNRSRRVMQLWGLARLLSRVRELIGLNGKTLKSQIGLGRNTAHLMKDPKVNRLPYALLALTVASCGSFNSWVFLSASIGGSGYRCSYSAEGRQVI